jgi:hypothetical protein
MLRTRTPGPYFNLNKKKNKTLLKRNNYCSNRYTIAVNIDFIIILASAFTQVVDFFTHMVRHFPTFTKTYVSVLWHYPINLKTSYTKNP